MTLTLDSHAARFPELGGTDRDVFVLLELSGGEPHRRARLPEQRAPLCLALAIDASSSMRGTRFALALQATRNVVASLGPLDRLAVVTFDRSARVVFGPTALDDDGKARARQALDRLSTGVGTNLGMGWREASEAVLRVLVPNTLRRVLVLTDGYPSRGESNLDALRARVAEGNARGVETSMVGIGDGIDEALCSGLAQAGEGRFHYVRDDGALGDVVAAEVDGAKAVIARDVSVVFALSPRVERAELLHRYACRPEGRAMVVRVGALTHEGPRAVLFSATLAPGSPDAALGAASASGQSVSAAPDASTALGYALGAPEHGTVSCERQSVPRKGDEVPMSRIYRSLPPPGTRLASRTPVGLDTRCAVAWMSRKGMRSTPTPPTSPSPTRRTPRTSPRRRSPTAPSPAWSTAARRWCARAHRHPVRRLPPVGRREEVLQHHAARPRGHRHRHRARHARGRRPRLRRRQHPQGQRHPAVLPLRHPRRPASSRSTSPGSTAFVDELGGRKEMSEYLEPSGSPTRWASRRPTAPTPTCSAPPTRPRTSSTSTRNIRIVDPSWASRSGARDVEIAPEDGHRRVRAGRPGRDQRPAVRRPSTLFLECNASAGATASA
jgi:hypothetical protein